jgi:hypothetical protein
MMKWKGCVRQVSWPYLRYYPGICMEGFKKTMKTLSQHSRSLGQDLNVRPPKTKLECEAQRSVVFTYTFSIR